ncbi:spherulation-specific family 4 protein [Streptomyces sp. NBC_00286]|uniref:spherulation-specific family 4 protein n=1 Tax=Streptomyces sp. NBC_00286 TaxID=2975701 RepID=UPI002E2BEC04|nr:spherulation-specific family 4 protein [Streptomyces sp. NBC_00286]
MSRLLVPYYEHPSVRPAEWEAIVAAAPRLYGVVLNPASGPGEVPDSAFAEIAERLRAAEVRVFGYVDTAYGRRPRAEVAADLTRHRDWYGTNGAFLDQVATGLGEFGHYQRLATAAWGAGCDTLVFNHGAPPHVAYGRLADVLVTFEGSWETYRTLRPAPWKGGSRTRLCHLVYGVPPGARVGELAHARGATVHCAVPGTGAHPWGTLPHALRLG